MTLPLPDLPVRDVLPTLAEALADAGAAVLEAPPGAGKTTLVPPFLLDAPWLAGRRILMLEPRRLAARAAATRIADLLGEPVGGTAGYATRFERRAGRDTRILVVTEGLLIRRLQADPALDGVGLVVFDELHERSLDTDLGLALTLEARAALRPDLRLLAMSATLDGAAVGDLLGNAPLVRSLGRLHPVAVEHLALDPDLPVAERVALGVEVALARTDGGVLAFLPGGREIEAARGLLAARLRSPAPALLPLYGDLARDAQLRAVAPPAPGERRVVLATNIAETSLTIEGIAAVVDGGLERRQRFSPRTGMSRLVTVPIGRASAEQRRGRAGRLGPGLCLRVWSAAAERGMAPHRPAEIEEADLAPLALELAVWGVTDAGALAWLTPPPAGALAQARALLADLGALDGTGRITAHGRQVAGLPVHPRLAHMLLRAAELGIGAAGLAVAGLLGTPGARPPRDGVDLADAVRRPPASREAELARRQLSRLAGIAAGPVESAAIGAAVALAYPDRVAQCRPGRLGAYRLVNGRGAMLPASEPLGAAPWLAVAELEDAGAEAQIRLAAALDEADVERLFAERIGDVEEVALDVAGTVVARRVTRLGALALRQRVASRVEPMAAAEALLEAVRERGLASLPWTHAARQLQARVAFLRRHGVTLPALDDDTLALTLEEWLLPDLVGLRRLADLARLDLAAILKAKLGHAGQRELERQAPAHLVMPTGTRAPIDYAAEPPTLAVRVQELFGQAGMPRLAEGRVPVRLELLSPARRPVAVTADLARFWRETWPQVRKELRGRYPKHPWPEDPLAAQPTTHAKRAG